MRYSVRIECWIEVQAQDEEEACVRGLKRFSQALSLIEEAGGRWELLEPEKLDEEAVLIGD